MVKYPNIELIVYKSKQIILRNNKSNKYAPLEFDVDVFPQTWSDTCTGFDITQEGDTIYGGRTITKEYTTVVHELRNDIYMIFFGDRFCYMVENAPESFYRDLDKRTLASLSEAKKIY